MVTFSRYRCDQHIAATKSNCLCDDIVKEHVERLKQKLSEIESIIQHASNSTYEEINKNEVRKLKKKINNLLRDVQLEQQNDVSNNLPTLITDTENVKKQIEKLIARFPIIITIRDVDTVVKDTENLLEKCKKEIQNANTLGGIQGEHNDEIIRLLDEAKQLLEQIQSLLPLITQIQNSYARAKNEIRVLDIKIKQLKQLYDKAKWRFLKDQYIAKRIWIKTNKTKQEALQNKLLLSNIRFPTVGNKTETGYCDLQVPQFQDDYEKKMREQFDKTQVEQNRMNEIHRNFTRSSQKADEEIEAHKIEVDKMKRVYNDYLDLVDGFVKNIEEIADIQTLNDANEADLKILQNELDNLIYKLELFLQQLEEIEKLTAINKEFLKVC